jgi:hypothetical protein
MTPVEVLLAMAILSVALVAWPHAAVRPGPGRRRGHRAGDVRRRPARAVGDIVPAIRTAPEGVAVAGGAGTSQAQMTTEVSLRNSP